MVAGACNSYYRATVQWLFLEKSRHVPHQFKFDRLTVVRRRHDDAVDELSTGV